MTRFGVFQDGSGRRRQVEADYQQRSADVLVSMGKPAQALSFCMNFENRPGKCPRPFPAGHIRLNKGTPDDSQAAFADLTSSQRTTRMTRQIHYNLGRA